MFNKQKFLTLLCVTFFFNTALLGNNIDFSKQESKNSVINLKKFQSTLSFMPASSKTVYAVGGATSGSLAAYLLYDTMYNATSCHTSNQFGKNKNLVIEGSLSIAFALLANYCAQKYFEEEKK